MRAWRVAALILLVLVVLVLLWVIVHHQRRIDVQQQAQVRGPAAAASLQTRADDASVVSRGDPRGPLPTASSPQGSGRVARSPIDAALDWAHAVATFSPAAESAEGGGAVEGPTPTPAAAATFAAGALPQPWRGLASCESTLNPQAVDPTGRYFGLFQFDLKTWESVGGTGLPSDATPEEQLYRAQQLQEREGWGPWPNCA